MTRLALSTLPWTLTGWLPHNWELNMTMETGIPSRPEVGPLPMRIPSSVQQTLLDVGIIPDWRDGLQARACEWVENRHWALSTTLPAGTLSGAGPHQLLLAGVDGPATIMVGKRVVAKIANTFCPHAIDLGPSTTSEVSIAIIFTDQPRSLGQVNRSSQIRDWRSRYPYVWDWTPRVLQVGLWEDVLVLSGPRLHGLRATSHVAADGTGVVTAQWEHSAALGDLTLTLSLSAASGTVLATKTVSAQTNTCDLSGFAVERWWPNGHGRQPLYQLTAELRRADGSVVDRDERQLGFRSVTWSPCANAPEGARAWICTVNDKPIFLQGANWVPLRTCFADVTPAEYAERLATYRDLGFNLLRVWGGGPLERDLFYRLCDAYGLMVWQEFPLSSSGIDNHPPAEPELVADMAIIAKHYVTVRQHHPSLIIWCGGNELQRGPDGGPGIGRPCDESEPMLAAQAAVCARLDPLRRYVPASSSGPRFMADAADFGRGLHHDVHGPWGWDKDLAGWQAYWNGDDSLIRTEVGFASAQGADLTRRHGGLLAWPPTRDNPYWQGNSSWWIQWDEFKQEHQGPADLDTFVAWSQQRQATFLAAAAAASKRRFPACAGFIVWMGHDCFPCPSNTAIIDVKGRPKPAALALAEIWKSG